MSGPRSVTEKRDTERILDRALSGDLEFHDKRTGYSTHAIHAFAAKFPPALPRTFISELTSEGETVLDPMVGSGTTVVEACLLGRNAIGFDIDPLALRISRVKTTPIPVEKLRSALEGVVRRSAELLSKREFVGQAITESFDPKTTAFLNYWFLPETQIELMSLALAIGELKERRVRAFFEVVFSSVIVTKSGGVSLARDLAHTRPHLDKAKTPKNAVDAFKARAKKSIETFAASIPADAKVTIEQGDARQLPLPDQSVDLIVTSPPYANAIDYMRAHKFSLVWFGNDIGGLGRKRAVYIGSERLQGSKPGNLPRQTRAVVERLSEKDSKKARVLAKYFFEMGLALAEMKRVLKQGRAAVVVVGPSTMREIEIPTHACIAEIACEKGFTLVGVVMRRLDRNRRMMPARFGARKGSGIEQRIHEEYVIGLVKQSRSW